MSVAALPEISQLQLDQVRDLIYDKTGILFQNKKDYILRNRLEQQMQTQGFRSFREYWNHIQSPAGKEELQHLIEALTINETYFFRDFPQLRGFAEEVLPSVLEKKRQKGDFKLRIWSAACSTGEEPYTLSIIVQEMIDDYRKWDVYIQATDIDRRVLETARTGEYGERSIRETPIPYREKYFTALPGKRWKVKPHTAKPIRFEQINLMDRKVMRRQRDFDFIFCRNVLIYFNDVSRKKVVNCFFDSLKEGGFLFLGSSESVGRITAVFELTRFGDFLCYKKPESGR